MVRSIPSSLALILLLLLVSQFKADGFLVVPLHCPIMHATSRLFAAGQVPPEDLITKLFSRFLPKPEDVGLTRFTVDSLPEKFPCTKTEFAVLLASDTDDNTKLIRPLLKQTNLEFRPLKLAYSAQRDGWKASTFHAQVDKKGPAVVLCRTESGGVFGGYNPCGWVNYGESRGCIAAFLFLFPGGDTKAQPVKLAKIGGASMAQLDDGSGPRFGAEGLTIPLEARSGVSARKVLSKLGLYYENLPRGGRSLLPEGRAQDELLTLDIYIGDFGSDPVPYKDAMVFQLN